MKTAGTHNKLTGHINFPPSLLSFVNKSNLNIEKLKLINVIFSITQTTSHLFLLAIYHGYKDPEFLRLPKLS